FSHLIRMTFPGPEEAQAKFEEAMRSAGIADQRLIALGVFAPHWAAHVEATLHWPGLASAIWWMHAHTKDRGWHVDADVHGAWKGEVAERTRLSSEDLLDGAVDTEWFLSVYSALGAERWGALDDAAKYTSSSGGHVRARLFADALRGAISEASLL